jgi:hypothetical protein
MNIMIASISAQMPQPATGQQLRNTDAIVAEIEAPSAEPAREQLQ